MTKVVRLDQHANAPATVVIGSKTKNTSPKAAEPKKVYKTVPLDPTFVFTPAQNDILVLLNRWGKKKLLLQGLVQITHVFNVYFNLHVPVNAIKKQGDLLWTTKHPMWAKGPEPWKVWRSLEMELGPIADRLVWTEPLAEKDTNLKAPVANGLKDDKCSAMNQTNGDGLKVEKKSDQKETNGNGMNINGNGSNAKEPNNKAGEAKVTRSKGKDQKGTGSRANSKVAW